MSRRYIAPGPRYVPPVYRCETCQRRATFGIGVRLAKGIQGRWYCAEHLPPREGTHAETGIETRSASAADLV